MFFPFDGYYQLPLDPSLVLWYAGDRVLGPSTSVPGDGTSLAKVWDLSGSAITATAAGAAQPVFKTNILNGQPIMRFDGTSTVSQLGVSTLGQSVAGLTGFAVFMSTTVAATAGSIIVIFNGAGTGRFSISRNAANFQMSVKRLDADTLTTIASTTNPIAINTYYYVSAVMNYTTGAGTIYVNGTQVGTNASLTSTGNTSNTGSASAGLGANPSTTNKIAGDIGEVLVYKRALGTTDRQAVELYLKNKYAL